VLFVGPRLVIRAIRPADEASKPETSSMTSEVAAAVESGATSRQSLPARPIGGETAEGRPALLPETREPLSLLHIAWTPPASPAQSAQGARTVGGGGQVELPAPTHTLPALPEAGLPESRPALLPGLRLSTRPESMTTSQPRPEGLMIDNTIAWQPPSRLTMPGTRLPMRLPVPGLRLSTRPESMTVSTSRPGLMMGNRRLMIDNTIAWQPPSRLTMPGLRLSAQPEGTPVTRSLSQPQWLSPAQPTRSPGILRTGQPPSPLELMNVVLERAGNARTVELGNARLVNAGNVAVVPVYASAVHTVMAGRPASVGNVVTRAELPNIERAVNAGALITEARSAPTRLTQVAANVAGRPAMVGNVLELFRPLGTAQTANIGAPHAVTRTVTRNEAVSARGVTTVQNVQSPTLTQRLNEVYAPVITHTIGSPTTIVARRTVGNVGTRVVSNVQGGLMVRGPQGGVYIPAQELLAAAAG